MQERCNSIANTLELHLPCTNHLFFLLDRALISEKSYYMTNFCTVFRSHLMIHWLHVDGWLIIPEATSKNWWGNFFWNLVEVNRSLPHTHFDGLVQERHNSSALAMELCLSCTNLSISGCKKYRSTYLNFWTNKHSQAVSPNIHNRHHIAQSYRYLEAKDIYILSPSSLSLPLYLYDESYYNTDILTDQQTCLKNLSNHTVLFMTVHHVYKCHHTLEAPA